MTWRLSVSYSVSHCFFSAASVCLPWPFGTGCFFFAATHFVKSGGSGTTARAALGLALDGRLDPLVELVLGDRLVADLRDSVRRDVVAAGRDDGHGEAATASECESRGMCHPSMSSGGLKRA